MERTLGEAGVEPGTNIEALEAVSLRVPEIEGFRARPRADHCGTVVPTCNTADFGSLASHTDFPHENHCHSPRRSTICGLRYQLLPYGQPKLIRVTRGETLDVNVNRRSGSETFGHRVKAEVTTRGGETRC